jgi:hypothetical protein
MKPLSGDAMMALDLLRIVKIVETVVSTPYEGWAGRG